MAKYLEPTEMDALEIFHLKMRLHQTEIDLLKEQDIQRALRSQALTEKMAALKWEIESLKFPDKKAWDRLVLAQAALDTVKRVHKEYIDTLKVRFEIPEDEDFGYDPDSGQVVTREEARLTVEDMD